MNHSNKPRRKESPERSTHINIGISGISSGLEEAHLCAHHLCVKVSEWSSSVLFTRFVKQFMLEGVIYAICYGIALLVCSTSFSLNIP